MKIIAILTAVLLLALYPLARVKVDNELQMTKEYSRQADAQERIAEALERLVR